jgi:excinuclease ABC subunit C
METPQETLKTLPHTPGVYLYINEAGETIYIGKAKDLKKRVSQYFQRDDAIGAKTTTLVAQIHRIKTIATDSEFDALLLEAKLIREFLPRYNVISRDDKSPLYIGITTHELLPRILWMRRTSLSVHPDATIFGPFQSARTVRSLLHDVRRIIPYCTQKNRNGKPCFYTHLGLCDPCPSLLSKMVDSPERKKLFSQYRSNIRKIVAILSGRSLGLLRVLEKDMKIYAKNQQYELAQKRKGQIAALHGLLERHFDPNVYMHNETFARDIRAEESESLRRVLSEVYPHIPPIHRIECIDISNTLGKNATGSLVVLIDGQPATSEYRRFKIRTKNAPNDVAMISEVLRRRVSHEEWSLPQLLVIDGGKGQVHAAKKVLEELDISLPLIGLSKRFEEIVVPLVDGWKIIKLPVSHIGLHMLERIRDESHRFALRYHRLLRSRAFLPRSKLAPNV